MARFNNVVVDIPKEATVAAGRVYIVTKSKYLKDRQYNIDSRLTIGWVNDSSMRTMNPNSNYAARYPIEFSAAAKGKLAPVTRRCGLYMLSLVVSWKNGLYPTLVDCLGPESANAVMDFANYSILFKSNVAKDYPHLMSDQVLYSEKLHSDSWLSELFEKRLTVSGIEDFKAKWVAACKEHGLKKVWLCIDGSNSDCSSNKVEYAEKGKARSHKNINIVSYTMAIDAETGLPVTERIYRGGRVDSKSFLEIMAYLRQYSITIEGVIVDRGYCDISCLELILDLKLKYIIKMKERTAGFNTMYKNHSDEIRMKSKNGMGNGIYAVTDECRIFGKYDRNSWITLVYDSVNGAARANYLYDKVKSAVDAANEQMKAGNKAAVEKGLRAYVTTIKEQGEVIRYELNHEKLQEEMNRKGFSAIAADSDYGAAEVLKKYELRDKSEKQYMVVKTQLGHRVFRNHYTEGVIAKGFVAFIGAIIRYEIGRICEQTGYELTTALREANFLCLQRTSDNTYMGVHNANGRQLELLVAAGLRQSDIDYFAMEETHKFNHEVHDQIHKIPEHSADTQENTDKRRPGRPKGSATKNVKESTEPKRKPGRPKGSKNKPKTTQTPQAATVETANGNGIPKRRGRPPGSKNKKPAVNAKAKRAAKRANGDG